MGSSYEFEALEQAFRDRRVKEDYCRHCYYKSKVKEYKKKFSQIKSTTIDISLLEISIELLSTEIETLEGLLEALDYIMAQVKVKMMKNNLSGIGGITMEDLKNKWPEVDINFMKEFANIHNQVALRVKTQEEFNKFVIENKEKFNNPDYLQVFALNADLVEEFYENNFEVCKIFYDFIEDNPELFELDYGLRTLMRLVIFQETFKKFLNKKDDCSD